MTEMVNLNDDNSFYYLCRLCALKCFELGLDIFSNEGILRDIKKKVENCLNLHIDEQDRLPKMICQNCTYKLDMFYEFLIKSLESQQYLADFVNNEMFNTIYVIKNKLQNPELCLELNELQVVCNDENVIQDLEHLVDEARQIHVDNTDISQIIQYHEEDMNNQQNNIHHLDISNEHQQHHHQHEHQLQQQQHQHQQHQHQHHHHELEMNHHKDDTVDSLPDIALYSFDSISDSAKADDFLDNVDFQDSSSNLMNTPTSIILNNDIIEQQQQPQQQQQQQQQPQQQQPYQQQQQNHEIHQPPPPPPQQELRPIEFNEQVSTIVTSSEQLPQQVEQILNINQTKKKKLITKTLNKCEICGKGFPTNYKLNEHMRSHSTEANFKCSFNECQKAFRSKIGLKQHEAQHLGNYRFSCETCGKGFEIKSYLTIHRKIHSDIKPYKCSVCDLQVKSKQALIDHENRHLGVKAFKCEMCEQRFISKAICLAHEKTHDLNLTPKLFPCTVCNKLFVRQSYLKTHMTIHNGNKAFICDICGKKLLTNLDLKLHSRTHTGEKEFICETCGKSFIRPNCLNIHRRSHTGEKPYKCKYCDQQFTQVTSMKIHVRLHTGEKPYLCSLCPKRFISRGYLKTHLKKHSKLPDDDNLFDTNFSDIL